MKMEKEYLRQIINYINNLGTLCNNFGSFSKVYNMTTENIYGFLNNYDLKDKNVLTVSGSGDQRLNAYFLGAKNVTCFDINPLTKFHMELKDKAIENINFEKFLNFFGIYTRKYGSYYKMLDYRIYDEFKDKLGLEVKEFYDYIINSPDIKEHDIYYGFNNDLRVLEKMNPYLTPSHYSLMKKVIKDKPIDFIESELEDLPDIIKGEKYDVILLSNISDYTHRVYEKDDLKQFRYLIDRLTTNLNKNGIMQVGYVYSEYSVFDDVSNFRYNEDRNKYFPNNLFYSVPVDSYVNQNYKDNVITYQKTK